jgi:cobalt-zinc-cadmium efflux system membrane fusion protein
VVRDAHVRTAKAEVQSLPSTIALTGEIAADPDLAADVAVRTAGRIVEVRVKEGQRVRKSELLAVVESAGASEARAALASATARARAARENADRLKRLFADGLAAGQEVRSAEAEARALEAEADAARGSWEASALPRRVALGWS